VDKLCKISLTLYFFDDTFLKIVLQ